MVITLQEELTIHRVAALYEVLTEALAGDDDLTLDLRSAREVDSSFLQLLCAVQRAAARQRKTVTLRLTEEPGNPFIRACQDAGLERLYIS